MTPEETATATAAAVSGLAANFMLDPATYGRGAELGFSGVDFYFGGRAGVLGPVAADVVAAAFGFFEPEHVRSNWAQATGVMAPEEAATHFIECGYAWADAHLGDGVDWARLGDLVGRIADAADPAGAPLFAAWRAWDGPDSDRSDKAVALYRFNLLRELRNGLHIAGVLAEGLRPAEALMVKTPHMAPIFGWAGKEPEVGDDHKARHAAADAATDRALAAAYAALDESEGAELAELSTAALAAVS